MLQTLRGRTRCDATRDKFFRELVWTTMLRSLVAFVGVGDPPPAKSAEKYPREERERRAVITCFRAKMH
jgi:hypothetical protein